MVSNRNVCLLPAKQIETMEKKVFFMGCVHIVLFIGVCVSQQAFQGFTSSAQCSSRSRYLHWSQCDLHSIYMSHNVKLDMYDDSFQPVWIPRWSNGKSYTDISPSSDSLFQLLTIFVSAKLAAYVKFYQSNKDFIDSLGE